MCVCAAGSTYIQCPLARTWPTLATRYVAWASVSIRAEGCFVLACISRLGFRVSCKPRSIRSRWLHLPCLGSWDGRVSKENAAGVVHLSTQSVALKNLYLGKQSAPEAFLPTETTRCHEPSQSQSTQPSRGKQKATPTSYRPYKPTPPVTVVNPIPGFRRNTATLVPGASHPKNKARQKKVPGKNSTTRASVVGVGGNTLTYINALPQPCPPYSKLRQFLPLLCIRAVALVLFLGGNWLRRACYNTNRETKATRLLSLLSLLSWGRVPTPVLLQRDGKQVHHTWERWRWNKRAASTCTHPTQHESHKTTKKLTQSKQRKIRQRHAEQRPLHCAVHPNQNKHTRGKVAVSLK